MANFTIEFRTKFLGSKNEFVLRLQKPKVVVLVRQISNKNDLNKERKEPINDLNNKDGDKLLKPITIPETKHWKRCMSQFREWNSFWMLWEPLKASSCAHVASSCRAYSHNFGNKLTNQWHMFNGVWNIHPAKDNRSDGIVYPSSSDHRLFCFTDAGDAVLVPLVAKVRGRSPFVLMEAFFMLDSSSRLSIAVTYSDDGNIQVALFLEFDSVTSSNINPSEKNIIMIGHPPVPHGSFSGKEMWMSPGVQSSTRNGTWAGFHGDIPESERSHYYELHLPDDITIVAPKYVFHGRPIQCVVTLVRDNEIKQSSSHFLSTGALSFVQYGHFLRR